MPKRTVSSNEAHGIGTVHVARVDSKVNSADLFTKALPSVDFRRHVQTVLGITQTGDPVALGKDYRPG